MRYACLNRSNALMAALVVLGAVVGCSSEETTENTGPGSTASSGSGSDASSASASASASGTGATGTGGGAGGQSAGGTGGEGTGGQSAGAGGSGGSGGEGGSSGTGGSNAGACPSSSLIGWAAASGHGVETTTGGGNATPVTVTTAAELQQYAIDPQPQVIQFTGEISIPELEFASNKTLIGLDPSATLKGGIRIRGKSKDPAQMISNVILRNFTLNAATGENDGDGVQIHYAHHVWADHLDIYDGTDGNLDVVHGSDFVTVSWTKFHYTDNAPDPSHRFSNLIGHSDNNAAEDTGRLHITYHHDWWADKVTERMPRIRFGEIHIFNNYYSAAGNNYSIGAGLQAKARVENNYFDGVNDPHIFYDGEPTAQIVASGNTYIGLSDTSAKQTGQGASFTPTYMYKLDTADGGLKDVVKQCAGPR